jgi:hypothetical protein
MRTSIRPTIRSDQRLPVAAALAVVVTTAADLAARATLWHVLTLGLVAALVAVVRVWTAGRDRGLSRVVAAAVALQPASQVGVALVPHGSLHYAPNGVGEADLLLTAVQLAAAAAIVGAVSFAEQIVSFVGTRVARAWARCSGALPRTGPKRLAMRPVARALRVPTRHAPGAIARRGPPRLLGTAA